MKTMMSLALAVQFAFSAGVYADNYETLQPEARLRRLSFITRGTDASEQDKSDLRVTPDANSFFTGKAKEYTSGSEFETKMISNLSRLFRVREPIEGSYNGDVNSLHLLFHKILSENLSWDQLLTSQTIGIPSKQLITGGADFFRPALSADDYRAVRDYVQDEALNTLRTTVYYTGTSKINWADAGKYITVNSPRIAGVLTDPQFLDRYWTTPINQERKRSSQIFRIFLCDEMRAVILPDSKSLVAIENAGLDTETDAKSNAANLAPQDVTLAARHASDQKCATCHSKLDPLGNVFRGGSNRLPSVPVAGALTYKRRSGDLVNVKFENAQGLAKALTSQPEYVSCQVHHFWDWFIGSDVAMSPKTEAELVKVFDQVGRRPRDFANYLVNRSEFYKFPELTVETVQYRHVIGVFQDCQSCHDNEWEAPTLTKLPFDDYEDSPHTKIVDELINKLDLLGDGSNAKMPPARAGWKLNGPDRTRLMAWLADGAPDDNGKPTWSNPEIQAQFKKRLQDERVSFDLHPTFDYTAHRRLTTYEFQREVDDLMKEIGVETSYGGSNYSPSYSGSSAVEFDLVSGSGISNPSSTYAKSLRQTTTNLRYYLNSPNQDQLKKLNLDFLNHLQMKNNGFTYAASWNQITTPQICEQIGSKLFVRLFAADPTPAEAANLKAYADRLAAKNVNIATCISETLTQLLWSSRNLTY